MIVGLVDVDHEREGLGILGKGGALSFRRPSCVLHLHLQRLQWSIYVIYCTVYVCIHLMLLPLVVSLQSAFRLT